MLRWESFEMKIFVTRKIPGDALEKLKSADHEVIISESDQPLTEEELLERAKGVERAIYIPQSSRQVRSPGIHVCYLF